MFVSLPAMSGSPWWSLEGWDLDHQGWKAFEYLQMERRQLDVEGVGDLGHGENHALDVQ
jgi:hypothetical protein